MEIKEEKIIEESWNPEKQDVKGFHSCSSPSSQGPSNPIGRKSKAVFYTPKDEFFPLESEEDPSIKTNEIKSRGRNRTMQMKIVDDSEKETTLTFAKENKEKARTLRSTKEKKAKVCLSSNKAENRNKPSLIFQEVIDQRSCRKIDKSFIEQSNSKEESEQDGTQEIYQCIECEFLTDSHKKLQAHHSKLHRDKRSDSIITKLITMRSNGKKYKIKIKKLDGIEPRFTCGICSKTYKTINILRMHIKDAHILKSNFECEVCLKRFHTSSGLNHHILADHLGVKKEFTCEYCSRTFDRTSSLMQHVSEVHLKERKYKCKICEKAYPRNSYLLKHVRSVHEGQKISHKAVVQCDKCQKDFYNKWTLSKHEREVHMKIKLWKCDECKKSFGRKNHLDVHKERKHSASVKSDRSSV